MTADDLELFWNNLLSRQEKLVLLAWESLERDEQRAIYAHLVRMATEDGWTAPQRRSAEVALQVLQMYRAQDIEDMP
ncbi:MAG: hypothetical protein ACUVSU_02745 [Aggregatilineaceae bacterium]